MQYLVSVGDEVDAYMDGERRDFGRRWRIVVIERVEEPDHELDHAGISFLQINAALLRLRKHPTACSVEESGVSGDEAAVNLELSALASDGEIGESFVVVIADSMLVG